MLCGVDNEDACHLFFFQCSYSKDMLTEILMKLELPSISCDIVYWSGCFTEARHSSNAFDQLRAAVFSLCVYGIWYARNKRLYAGHHMSVLECCRWIVQLAYWRLKAKGIKQNRRIASIGRNFGVF